MGAATVLLAELERFAASAGARRVILQSGGKQPEAEAFYRKLGYRRMPTYPPYEDAIPTSICFAKQLQPMKDRLPSVVGQE